MNIDYLNNNSYCVTYLLIKGMTNVMIFLNRQNCHHKRHLFIIDKIEWKRILKFLY